MVEKPPEYWNQVGETLVSSQSGSDWRAYCDGLYRRWLMRSLSGRTFSRTLKTDLYDEAVGQGALQGLSSQVIGIDMAVSTAALANRRHRIAAVAADVLQLPFPDGAFQLVISLSTLDHFEDAASITRAIQEIRRVLPLGGILAITLDNLSHPLIRLRNSLPWPLLARLGLVPYFVGATLTQRQLVQALTANGFRITASTALMHTPRVLLVLLPWLARYCGAWERLASLPTRYQTGLYIALIAEAT